MTTTIRLLLDFIRPNWDRVLANARLCRERDLAGKAMRSTARVPDHTSICFGTSGAQRNVRALRHRRTGLISFFTGLFVASLAITSCANPSPKAITTSTTTPIHHVRPTPHATVSLYWLRDGSVLGVSHRKVVATSPSLETMALATLLAGPNDAEAGADFTSAIPRGSHLLGLSIANGIATANFNSAFASGAGSFSVRARVAQVVYTLTSFAKVKRVRFEVNGQIASAFSSEGLLLDHPVGRAGETDLLPPILLEDPAVGDSVRSPLYVYGLANTFEATLEIDLIDGAGHVLLHESLTASQGSGNWGTFEGRYHFAAGKTQIGHIKAYERSAKDGSRIHAVDVPITIERSS